MRIVLIAGLTFCVSVTACGQDNPLDKPLTARSDWEGRVFVTDDEPEEKPVKIRYLVPSVQPSVSVSMTSGLQRPKHSVETFIVNRLKAMHNACGLTWDQTKKLRMAGKGAAHRIRSANKNLNFPRDHSDLLDSQSIWTQSVDKILTEEQKKRWKAHASPRAAAAARAAAMRRAFERADFGPGRGGSAKALGFGLAGQTNKAPRVSEPQSNSADIKKKR